MCDLRAFPFPLSTADRPRSDRRAASQQGRFLELTSPPRIGTPGRPALPFTLQSSLSLVLAEFGRRSGWAVHAPRSRSPFSLFMVQVWWLTWVQVACAFWLPLQVLDYCELWTRAAKYLTGSCAIPGKCLLFLMTDKLLDSLTKILVLFKIVIRGTSRMWFECSIHASLSGNNGLFIRISQMISVLFSIIVKLFSLRCAFSVTIRWPYHENGFVYNSRSKPESQKTGYRSYYRCYLLWSNLALVTLIIGLLIDP